jgi:hypothetical protein
VITVRIRLRDFNNREIGRAMEELASMLRPSTEKEPTRKGTGKRDTPRSWLDSLSAMRLASHYPKGTAIKTFSEIQLVHVGRAKRQHPALGEPDIAQSNFERLAAKARRLFADLFPFAEPAANGATYAQRRHARE